MENRFQRKAMLIRAVGHHVTRYTPRTSDTACAVERFITCILSIRKKMGND